MCVCVGHCVCCLRVLPACAACVCWHTVTYCLPYSHTLFAIESHARCLCVLPLCALPQCVLPQSHTLPVCVLPLCVLPMTQRQKLPVCAATERCVYYQRVTRPVCAATESSAPYICVLHSLCAMASCTPCVLPPSHRLPRAVYVYVYKYIYIYT